MIRKLMMAAVVAACIAIVPKVGATTPTGVNGTVRGVTFYYLDGAANPYANPPVPSQGFEWVLNHQYDPDVRERLDNLLAQYRAAGVNWIRLLIASNNFSALDMEPVPSAAWIKKLNDFLAITRAGDNAGQFHIEIVLVPLRTNGLIADTAPYNHDKAWLKTWLDNINFTNVGQIMLGGDLSPCLLSGCQGSSGASTIANNHGAWIRSIWAWKDSNYPTLNASYEVIGVQGGSNNNPALISMMAHWSAQYTPTNPTMSAGLYVTLSPGATWQQYAAAFTAVLDSYAAATAKNLHIDEYGLAKGTGSDGVTRTLADQRAGYQGMLGAMICWRQKNYAKFAWGANRDYPYDVGPNRARWYGLVDSFDGNMPVMSPTWGDIKLYYTLQSCP